MQPTPHRRVLLIADDYGLSAGVSEGIRTLIERRRLSGTSVMVTFSRWAEDAHAIKPLRGQTSIGLHLNLTVGTPMGAMPVLAPGGELPDVGRLTRLALFRSLDVGELASEISRQLDAFEMALGYPPDHIDGHQHVHALPGVRQALMAALKARPGLAGVLVRDPADLPLRIMKRGLQVPKALSVAALASGFGRLAKKNGFAVNRGFSGFSDFAPDSDYQDELCRAWLPQALGTRHMVMCHPGYPDAELAARDPVTVRRREELDALLAMPEPGSHLIHIERFTGGPPLVWDDRVWQGAA
ncbi:MAG: ChbG/HpnK family deacetylase [Hyphomicrobiaceae bacterium]